jgi:hypothetical protein
MKKNMGITDRAARLVAAAAMVVLYFLDVITGLTGVIMLIVAGVLAVTAVVRFCPLYLPLGIRTCKRD